MLNFGTIEATHNIAPTMICDYDLALNMMLCEFRSRARAKGHVVESHNNPTHVPVDSPIKLDRFEYMFWGELDRAQVHHSYQLVDRYSFAKWDQDDDVPDKGFI